ncbi:MAG: TonB-dependent receptor [Acidobacteriaceae bacterium]|nr:TonB-dependent receptor [Acidobacteriaceae bacterium]
MSTARAMRLSGARFYWRAAVAAALVIAFSAFSVVAQALYGSLTGNVTDGSGAAIPNATVAATNNALGITKTVQTNSEGVYLITDLQAGPYTVKISAPAFGAVTQTGIAVGENTSTRSDAQLAVAGVSETVSVSAAAQLLQTDRGDLHTDITTQQVSDLPESGSTGRNFENLLKLVPGVTPPQEQNSAAGNPERAESFNVNGSSYANNNVRLDGASVIYAWLPYLISYVPPEEAIQEVNIETNSFLAEQGTAGGSVVNVIIRNGTNQFHGAAWEYNTNTDFNARPFFFFGTQLPKNILNQFGARMGGPILRNKLFFFGDWERTEQRQAISGTASLPTANLKNGLFCNVAATIYNPYTGNANGTGRVPFPTNGAGCQVVPVNPAAATYLALLPNPNQPVSGITNDYFGAASYALTRDNADGKITYNPNASSQLFGRYSISKGTIADPFQFGAADGGAWDGGQPGVAFTKVQDIALGGTHTISPTMVLDGNAGFTRQRLGAEPPDVNSTYALNTLGIPGTNTGPLQGGIPFFQISGFSNLGNSNTGNPFLFRDNTFLGNLNFGWVRGSHSLRFGWDWTHSQINHFQPQGGSFTTARGSFLFNGDLTALSGGAAPNQFNAFADFLVGLPSQVGKVVQNINPNALRFTTLAFYAQDQWQVSPKLTLTYGLRYEYYPFLTRDHFGNFTYQPPTNLVLIGCEGGVPCDTGEDVGIGFFAPRLGFAYRLDQKTVIRGGFGLTADPDNYRDMRNTYPAVITYNNVANSFQAAGGLTPAVAAPVDAVAPFVAGIPPITGPNLSLGKIPLPNNISTQAIANPYRRGYLESYNVAVQRDLGLGFTGSAAFVGTHEVRQMSDVDLNASCLGCGNAGRLLFVQYHTVNGDIEESDPFGSMRYDALQMQLQRRAASLQMGVSYTRSRTLDMGDNSTYNALSFSYPAYRSRNWAPAGYDRPNDLSIWAIYELPFGKGHNMLQHGIAAAILGGWQVNTVFTAANGTPFTVTSNTAINAPGNIETAQQILPSVQILGGIGAGQPWFNPAAFANPAQNTFGNSGRNSLRGPGFFELDASLFRDFSPSEKFKLQLRAESFAITNSPIFGNPAANVSTTSSFGQITSLAASANGVSTGGGYRIIRLGMRFSF